MQVSWQGSHWNEPSSGACGRPQHPSVPRTYVAGSNGAQPQLQQEGGAAAFPRHAVHLHRGGTAGPHRLVKPSLAGMPRPCQMARLRWRATALQRAPQAASCQPARAARGAGPSCRRPGGRARPPPARWPPPAPRWCGCRHAPRCTGPPGLQEDGPGGRRAKGGLQAGPASIASSPPTGWGPVWRVCICIPDMQGSLSPSAHLRMADSASGESPLPRLGVHCWCTPAVLAAGTALQPPHTKRHINIQSQRTSSRARNQSQQNKRWRSQAVLTLRLRIRPQAFNVSAADGAVAAPRRTAGAEAVPASSPHAVVIQRAAGSGGREFGLAGGGRRGRPAVLLCT